MKPPEIIIQDGKPVAVILDINRYQELLERLEDTYDLKLLEKMREKQLSFKSLNNFLNEYNK